MCNLINTYIHTCIHTYNLINTYIHTYKHTYMCCVFVCVFFPFILDIKFVGRTSRGHTGGRSHKISLPIHSGHQVRWTYQPGSHRRKVTQDFSSTFFLRCVPSFFSREGFSHSFSLVDREVEFCVLTIQSFSIRWAFLVLFFSFLVRKITFAGIELTSQRVRGLRGTSELPGRPAEHIYIHTCIHTYIYILGRINASGLE